MSTLAKMVLWLRLRVEAAKSQGDPVKLGVKLPYLTDKQELLSARASQKEKWLGE